MSNTLAPVVGAVVCCVVPLATFVAGVMYARYGSPIAIRLGWQRRERYLEED